MSAASQPRAINARFEASGQSVALAQSVLEAVRPAEPRTTIWGTLRGSLVCAKRSSTACAARVRRPGRACS